MLLLIILLILMFGGARFYGYRSGCNGRRGMSLASVLVIVSDNLSRDGRGSAGSDTERLVSVSALEGFTEADVLRLAASLERGSEHPLAAAIVAGAEARKLTLATAEDFKSVTGQGVTGRIEGSAVALGNQHMMRELGVAFDAVSATPTLSERMAIR